MDERTTLRSHLNRFASQAPQGGAIGEVIEAIAATFIRKNLLGPKITKFY